MYLGAKILYNLQYYPPFVSILAMLKIRLQRVGRKHEPVFRVVLTDSKNGPKSGKYLEMLGTYDTRSKERRVVDGDRIKYWMGQGAKLSLTMHNFLINTKVIEGKKLNALSRKSPIKKEEVAGEAKVEAAPVAEASKAEEKKAEAPAAETPKA